MGVQGEGRDKTIVVPLRSRREDKYNIIKRERNKKGVEYSMM